VHVKESLIGELQEQAGFTHAWRRARKTCGTVSSVTTEFARGCIVVASDGDGEDARDAVTRAPVSPMTMYLKRKA